MTVLESELELRQSLFTMPSFPCNTVVVLRATLVFFKAGFNFCKSVEEPCCCARVMMKSSARLPYSVYPCRRLRCVFMMSTKFRRIPVTVLRYRSLKMVVKGAGCALVIRVFLKDTSDSSPKKIFVSYSLC